MSKFPDLIPGHHRPEDFTGASDDLAEQDLNRRSGLTTRTVQDALNHGLGSDNLNWEYREIQASHGVPVLVKLQRLTAARGFIPLSVQGQGLIFQPVIRGTDKPGTVSITFRFGSSIATNVMVAGFFVPEGVASSSNAPPMVLSTADGGTGLTTVGANGTVLTSNGTTLSYMATGGGALPSGGVLGQSVVNTGTGTGAWDWAIPNVGFGRRFMYWIIDLSISKILSVGGTNTQSVSNTTLALGVIASRPSLVYTTTAINGHGGWFSTAPFATPGHLPRARGLFRSPASLANKRWWFYFATGQLYFTAPLASGSAASIIPFAGLAYDSSVSPNFLLNSGDGANYSGVDTGLAVVAGTDYYVDLDWTVAGTVTARIYATSLANAPTVTSKSTNIYAGTTVLSCLIDDTGFVNGVTMFELTAVLWDAN